MHLRLDDLRKQARMLQMYEWERTRTRSGDANSSIQTSAHKVLKTDPALGSDLETRTSLTEPVQPID